VGEESLWVGPSKCDEQRLARERDIEGVWDELISTREYEETYPLLASALDLFREALSCYQNGAYMASALMCRASSEAAVYLLTSREIKGSKDWEAVREIKVDYNFINDEWGNILCRAKRYGYVSGELEQQLNKIREAGNFAAHYGRRLDKKLSTARKIKNRVQLWIGREDARRTLYRTANLLKALMGKAFDKHVAPK